MGAPIPDLPAPGGGQTIGASGCVGGGLGFSTPSLSVPIPCLFTLKIPSFSFLFNLPSISLTFYLKLPTLLLNLTLNCDLTKPIDITGGVTLPAAGGRIGACQPDPDLFEVSAS